MSGTRSTWPISPTCKRWYETMMARPGTKRGFEVALS